MEWDNLAVLPISTFRYWWTRANLVYRKRNEGKAGREKGVSSAKFRSMRHCFVESCDIHNETARSGRESGFPTMEWTSREHAGMQAPFSTAASLSARFLRTNHRLHQADDRRSRTTACAVTSGLLRARDKAPTNALIAKAVRSCADRGFSFWFTSTSLTARKRATALATSRNQTASGGWTCPAITCLCRLSAAVALNLGLHHRLVDYLPEQLDGDSCANSEAVVRHAFIRRPRLQVYQGLKCPAWLD